MSDGDRVAVISPDIDAFAKSVFEQRPAATPESPIRTKTTSRATLWLGV